MRLQLALNVPELDSAIAFYTKLFSAAPAKVKPGYANWSLDDPPLKLVLFEAKEAVPGSINHLGVETDSAHEVVSAEQRLRENGLVTTGIDETICCYAQKVETWVTDPLGHRWEWYVKQGDVEDQLDNVVLGRRESENTGGCCV